MHCKAGAALIQVKKARINFNDRTRSERNNLTVRSTRRNAIVDKRRKQLMTIRIEAHCEVQQERQGEGKVDRDKPPLLWN